MMKNEKKTLRDVKKKVQASEVKLHFLAKEYQNKLKEIPPGATIGPEGQAIAANLIAVLNAKEYCKCVLQELLMIDDG